MLQDLNQRMAQQQASFDRRLQQQLDEQQNRFNETTRDIENVHNQRLQQERNHVRADAVRIVAQSSPRVLEALQNI